MILRILSWMVLSMGLAAVLPAASAKPLLQPVPGHASKMVIYLAQGAANSCGPGCDRWIAVEGNVDSDAAATVARFLRKVKDTSLPFYFNSPGGDVRQGLAIGRMLRARKAVGRVGQTVVARCPGEQSDDACIGIKAGGVSDARIVTRGASCNSSCGYLLLGASRREVALDAVIGVHNTKILSRFHGRPTAQQRAEAERRAMLQADRDRAAFVSAMGISLELVDLIKTIKFENGRALTRDELYRFRIDTRTLVETEWLLDTTRHAVIRKRAMAKKDDGPSFRMLEWRLSCEGRDRVRLMFLRQFDKDTAGTTTVALSAGPETSPSFGIYPARLGAFEAWSAVMSANDMEKLYAVPHLQVGENTAAPDGRIAQSILSIQTGGLDLAWAQMAAICGAIPAIAAKSSAFPVPVYAPAAKPETKPVVVVDPVAPKQP